MDAGAFNRARSAQVDGFIRRRDAISPAAALDSDAGRFSAACRRRLQSAVDCLTRRDWLREARGGGGAIMDELRHFIDIFFNAYN